MTTVVLAGYAGHKFSFTDDGWFNATNAAARYSRRPIDWLRLPETRRYVLALARSTKVDKSHFARTQRGGRPGEAGTWLHPKLAVRFSQWLDVDFAVWCDAQISELVRGTQKRKLGDLWGKRLEFEARNQASKAKSSEAGYTLNERKRFIADTAPEAQQWKALLEPDLFIDAPKLVAR